MDHGGSPWTMFNAFRSVTDAALNMAEVVVKGFAVAMAPIPGIGDKAFAALKDFEDFKGGVSQSMDEAGRKITEFSDNAVPKLRGQRLGLQTSEFERGLAAAGEALTRTNLNKKGKLSADKTPYDQAVSAVRAAKVGAKSVVVKADTTSFYSSIGAIAGRFVANAYVNIGAVASGRVPGHAGGGAISGPGSATSDSIPAMLSNGEFVVNAAATKRNRGLLEAINSGTVQHFAKGGLTDAMKQARSDATAQLTLSHFGRMAGYKNTSVANQLGGADSLGDLVGALGKWRSLIKAATSGLTESRLLRGLDSTAASLIKQEKALTSVNTALDKAKDKLASLKDAAAQMASSVSSGILGSGNLTGMAQAGGLVTVGGIKSGLSGTAGEAKEFAAALAALKKRGLNAQSLSEIAQAGLGGGGLGTARALMGASAGDIKEINSLESQLKGSASAAGKATSDAMYGAGIAAANGLVKGLQAKQDKLESTMAKAAEAFARQLKKSLGVKGKASGGVIGAASGGPRGGLTWVGEQGPELVRIPSGSTVYPAGQSRQMAGAGGGQPIVIHNTITLDGRVVAEQLINPLAGVIRRRNGGDVQALLGQGKVRT
ncbi:hypothetical protein [Streptomyces sp. MI02-7b]|uniref:hypothetical protein n=1 Tax=Streptomyces sp. MI02-7b TaxID=462941 RepID=UPI0029A8B1A4|nr:hypothetical protein [Streptomyces sp. MI02-7b]MDX3073590.1 hypothetical protein [Streptomyces sp. MI02-7b]